MQTLATEAPRQVRAEPVSIRLPVDLRERAERKAAAEDRSLSYVLVQMIRKGMDAEDAN